MADNVAITAGAGTSIATDEVGSVHYQRVKATWGADGVATDVSSSNPLPVQRAQVSTAHLVTAATTNATVVKASAGVLKSVHIYNNAAYPVYAKFHNTASAPTAGASVLLTVAVQAGQARDFVLPGGGRAFAAGIGMTVVKGIADSDTTAVALNDAQIEVTYE